MSLHPPSVDMTDWEREIAAMIVEALGLEVGAEELAPEEPLYGGDLGLDSIDMLEIATVGLEALRGGDPVGRRQERGDLLVAARSRRSCRAPSYKLKDRLGAYRRPSRALRLGVIVYVVYSLAVFGAVRAGQPGLALAVTLVAVAVTCLAVPRRRPIGYAMLAIAPVALMVDPSLSQWVTYLPPVAINLGLAVVFARTLAPSASR